MDTASRSSDELGANPTLPGGTATPPPTDDGRDEDAGTLSSRRVGTFRRLGYAGVMPPLLPTGSGAGSGASSGSVPRLASGSTDRKPTGAPAVSRAASNGDGDAAEDTEPSGDVATLTIDALDDPTVDGEMLLLSEVSTAPVNPLTGLPDYPTGPVTPTPAWKKRRRSIVHRVARVLLLLALIGVFGAVLWIGFDQYRPADDETAVSDDTPRPLDDDAPPVDDGGIRPEVEVLLDELQLDEEGRPLVAADAVAYEFVWVDPFGFEVNVRVDAATANFHATTSQQAEIRRVGDRYFGRGQGGPWVELSGRAGAAIPPMFVDGPLVAEDVMPAWVEDYVVFEDDVRSGWRRVLVDDARLAAEDPQAREAWLGPWGLLDDVELPAPAVRAPDALPAEPGPGDLVVRVRVERNGVVRNATLSSPSLGGTAAYTLVDAAETAFAIEVPRGFED